MILLIDFAYNVSENLLGLWENTEDKRYLYILLGITSISILFTIVITSLGIEF